MLGVLCREMQMRTFDIDYELTGHAPHKIVEIKESILVMFWWHFQGVSLWQIISTVLPIFKQTLIWV